MAEIDSTENGLDGLKWRTPVKLVTYMQLIVDVVAVLALFAGFLAILYPLPADSPWAPLAVSSTTSFSNTEWIYAILAVLLKFWVDIDLLRATHPERSAKDSILLCSHSVIFYIFNIAGSLTSDVFGSDDGTKDYDKYREHHQLQMVIVLYYTFCLFPIKMFLDELHTASHRNVGTDPPSPEEVKMMEWERSVTEHNSRLGLAKKSLSGSVSWSFFDFYS